MNRKLLSFMALSMIFSAKAEAAPSVAPVELPAWEESRLENGMRLIVAKRGTLPLASVELLIEAGGADDPAGKAGLASFMSGLLRRGTEGRSADEIVGAIEFVGGSLDAASGPDASTVNASVTSENLALAMELVADVALRPSFPKGEFDTHKRRVLAELAQELDDPAAVADRHTLRTLLPGGHPYAEPTAGTRKTVATFTRGDLKKFHDTHFTPARSTLIVVGDVDPKEVVQLAGKFFGGWKAKEVKERQPPAPPNPQKNQILVIHKDQATQVQVRVVGLSFREKTSPEFFPATIANGAFGGGFTSRLVDEIRVNRGLSYNANSRFLQLRDAGFFLFKSFTRNDTVGELLTVALGEAKKAREKGFSEQEIDRAKSYLAGLYPLRLETNDQIAGAFAEKILYGLPEDWVSTYRQNLVAVKLDEANRAAREFFFAKPFGLVLVGDEEAIAKGLKEAGIEGEVTVRSIEDLD